MAKSLLTTEEIRELRKTGLTIAKIAERAGISKSGIIARLFPKNNRVASFKLYHNLKLIGDTSLMDKNNKRHKDAQEKTMEVATVKYEPWTEEELNYLRQNGQVKPAWQIAFDLGRTYRAVKNIAFKRNISLRKP